MKRFQDIIAESSKTEKILLNTAANTILKAARSAIDNYVHQISISDKQRKDPAFRKSVFKQLVKILTGLEKNL